MRFAGLVFAALGFALSAAVVQGAEETTSCLACHSEPSYFDSEWLGIVSAHAGDVHDELGLSCHDCHGGNPDPTLADDPVAAMDESYAANPFVGAPAAPEAPGFCGRCHSDPTYMRRFRPDARVDQEQEYWTSYHGIALRSGDTKVATCVDCHGAHGVLRPTNPASRVFPTQVAETCGACHSDAERMSGYRLDNGLPLPVDQQARWRRSVHAAALLEREDLSAPTCNDCHGNHGAAPPGLDSVTYVCGQCHGREAGLFRASPKAVGFDRHNEYLADAGEEGCAACHEAPDPAAALGGIHSLGECAACHGNHGVVRPTVALLSPLPETPCSFCHEGPNSIDQEVTEAATTVRRYQSERDRLLSRADELGLESEDRFNWLVDQALELEFHTVVAGGDAAQVALRPEFERLFSKFRIGKTYFSYQDPATDEEVRAPVLRCSSCHAAEPLMADDARGLEVAEGLLADMHRLTALTGRAERILLRARRGGVETRPALAEIDQAVDSQIQLEVLAHTFEIEEGGQFATTAAEGLQHARAALEAGREAQAELAFRRRGLALSLGVIGLVLIGLALKIGGLSGRGPKAGSATDRPT